MPCRADAHARVRAAARAADCDGRVVAVDVLDAEDGPVAAPELDLVLSPEASGAPPALLRELAAHELTIRDVSPRNLYWRVLVTA